MWTLEEKVAGALGVTFVLLTTRSDWRGQTP
jgi:hypothetical protein